MNEDDFAQLKALGDHRRAVTPAWTEAIERVDMPRDRDGIQWTHLRVGMTSVVIQWPRKGNPIVGIQDTGIRTVADIDTVMALLSEARKIMSEGGA